MSVRVRVRIEPLAGAGGAVVDSVALVNTGFTPEERECSLPAAAAQNLGMWPALPAGTVMVGVRGYTGEVTVARVPRAVRARVVCTAREGPTAEMATLITTTDNEVILSDAAVEALGIVPVKPCSGQWRFIDDPHDRLRPSEPAQYW